MPPKKQPRPATFWRWLFFGLDSYPGILRLFDHWSVVHVFAGFALALLVPVPLEKAASVILLPLAGAFIGLTFTWIGNAQVILQEERTKQIARHGRDGHFGVAYTFQLIVLVLLIVLSLWAIAGLGVFDQVWPGEREPLLYLIVAVVLYGSASLAVRGCWHAVFGSQFLLLAPYIAERMRRDMEAQKATEESAPPPPAVEEEEDDKWGQ